jgi:hypothetical protein
MDQKEMVKQMIEFNQTTFNNVYDSIVMIQDQFESVAMKALDQSGVVPDQGRKAIASWAKVFKNSRKDIKAQFDNGFQQAEKLLEF